MHWNINSLSAHNYIKLSSLQAFNSIHKFDIISVNETFLNSSFSTKDPALTLKGYKLIRSDHPQDLKRGGVGVFYKETLPIKILNIFNLPECLVCEIQYQKNKCFIVSLYRSPSQDNDAFDSFLSEFEIILNSIVNPNNPNHIIIVGDFNAKLSTWKKDDPDTREGIEIGSLTSSFGLTQIITEATHILPNSSTCIDLLFTNQPNIIIEAGVLPSLHPNCHHQIIYAKINFEIFFPPTYHRHIWHYSKADVNGIRESINRINWDRVFLDINVNKQVELFNNYIMNIFYNFIPNETISINDNDPPWITEIIRMKIAHKNYLYKNYLRNGKTVPDFLKVQDECKLVNDLISESKDKYYNRLSFELKDPKTSPMAY